MIGNSSSWSRLEDKAFERALVVFPEETPYRWEKIASQIPGKTWIDVKKHYEDLVHDVGEIDSGRVELPNYEDELGLDSAGGWGSATESGTSQVWFGSTGKGKETTERRKGIPWTEEEHRLFLIGLQRYGKGDWRSISRNAVVSRTPTQVASHAQKYFLRINSIKKDKKRPSIHDVTTNATNHPISAHDLMDPNPFSHPDSPSAYHGFGFPM
ncbi:hypothetical protein P3X46_009835 [Hevea brasiliensis]|uniref:Uncharacterized protein n=1 Tax=Hevea brasiliensis TaxID=3981 RepID=A0ABQ9MC91_HEVBR|nr:transcription factor SRM1 [Hevea brasiliensis]KAJ9177907.1 hypothetical protein P3X46_009835 [Hevea brasiliensis]